MKLIQLAKKVLLSSALLVAISSVARCDAAIHKNTKVKYVGKTARITVPNTWHSVGSGYVANAPLEDLSIILKRKPSFSKFRVNWRSDPPGDSMSGTALYIRSRGTVEVFTRHAWTEKTVRTHVLYTGVTDAILHKLAKVHKAQPTDGYTVDASAFFSELVDHGCKMRSL